MWSGTPPVETTTSRNKNARKISQNFRGNPHKLRRILQFSTEFCKNRTIFAEFGGKFAEFCVICKDFRENSAKCCEHVCFDWSLFRLVASCLVLGASCWTLIVRPRARPSSARKFRSLPSGGCRRPSELAHSAAGSAELARHLPPLGRLSKPG